MSLAEKLAQERRGRLAAERLLELKQAELYAANRKLGLHARALSEEIVETRAKVETVTSEYQRVKSDLSVAHQKVEIAERRLWLSIQTIQDGFAFFDTDDKLIAANDSYLVVFEGLEEVKPGIAYARILQLLTEEGIVDTGDLSAADWRADMLRRRQHSEPSPVVIRLWNGTYIKVVDHRGVGGDVVSLGLNITATVRYERELEEARERAEAAARAKSSFLANMSHEIRTPMNGVVGMAELLAESDLTEEQRLYADTIRNSGEALLVIINDVLDYSKIEAQKMVLHNGPFDLEKAIHEVLMLVQPAAREKNVALLLDYDLFLPHLFIGDAGRIRQILTNLIGNAVKFTPEGHVLVRVTGAPDPNSDRTNVHIAVEDTGIGISEEKQAHVFGEFTQVEDERNRKFEGTGLGLAISKRLVHLMGGEMWVTSELGIGSCFGFKLPLDLQADRSPPHMRLPENIQRVLIIDDNSTNRDILRRQLTSMSATVMDVESAIQALDLMSEGFDLVLVDHQMPGMDGPTFIKEIRARGDTTPVIILTSNPGGLTDPSIEAEVSAIIPRPLPRQRLFSILRDLGVEFTNPDEPQQDSDFPMPVFRHREAPTSDKAPALPAAPEPQVEATPPVTETKVVAAPAPPPEPQPITAATPSPLDAAAAPETPASSAPTTRRMRVLAAEDNKTNQLVFRKMIKALDIEVEIANNGREAVEKFRSFAPDMIFMDISMPEMDGKEATQEIRRIEQETGGRVPIVALTAHAMDGDGMGILEAGLDHYMTKPLRKPAIHEMINMCRPQDTLDPFASAAA
ncbi:response regulator [Aliishimia ponticola]|uniref:histidine kinase n=1 Tax=Aliishimia ponticola TaxID=2499833 RepID=A0A4V3XJY0_9RHOB|nr:response regulator [Aliishimia ponticola]THH34823.1 response regulator [Aliishimia ponticola]